MTLTDEFEKALEAYVRAKISESRFRPNPFTMGSGSPDLLGILQTQFELRCAVKDAKIALVKIVTRITYPDLDKEMVEVHEERTAP
jgi:hypothetical protein